MCTKANIKPPMWLHWVKSWEEKSMIHCHESELSPAHQWLSLLFNVGHLTPSPYVPNPRVCLPRCRRKTGKGLVGIELKSSWLQTLLFPELPTVIYVGRCSLIQALMLKTQFASKRQYKPQCSYPLLILTLGSATWPIFCCPDVP